MLSCVLAVGNQQIPTISSPKDRTIIGPCSGFHPAGAIANDEQCAMENGEIVTFPKKKMLDLSIDILIYQRFLLFVDDFGW